MAFELERCGLERASEALHTDNAANQRTDGPCWGSAGGVVVLAAAMSPFFFYAQSTIFLVTSSTIMPPLEWPKASRNAVFMSTLRWDWPDHAAR